MISNVTFKDVPLNNPSENNEYSIAGLTAAKSKSRIYKTLNARKMSNSNYQKRKESTDNELYNT